MSEKFQITKIEKMIYVIRGQKVMLDSDLADLYGVETKMLNRQVARNILRFPDDFAFKLSELEVQNLRYQFGTSSLGHGGRRYLPYVFTENGVAMLSTVLRSETAIQVNISIMRIFTKLRSFFMLETEMKHRMNNLEENTNKMFKIVFERLDEVDEMVIPKLPEKRKKIGFKT